MQLFSSRVRIALMLLIWLIALGALVLWLSSARVAHVTVGGGPAGSETLALAQAIAEVLNASNAGFDMRVFETGGSAENMRLLKTGQIDFGTVQADTPVPEGIVGVTTLYSDAYHLIVQVDSGIHTFSDLRNHRIAIPPSSSGQFYSFWFLANHFGLQEEDLNALPMAEAAANFAMEQGQVDAIFRVRAPGNNIIRELIGDKALRLVPILQSEALGLKQPAISPGIIPLGSYRGSPALPELDLATAVLSRLLVARENLDTRLVYSLTKQIYERRSDILEHSKLAGFIGPLPEDSVSAIPAHLGARHYYDREKPGFMQQNARLVSAILYMAAIIFSALLGLRSYWIKSRRLRMTGFNQRLMAIATTVGNESDTSILAADKKQLVEILAEVISDLDKQKVSQEEFEHFSFTWQAVDALVRDQINLVHSGPFETPSKAKTKP
ncbi:MAG: TAXI family TRAP transporter solute-binding subunit [Halioglobus sp.]